MLTNTVNVLPPPPPMSVGTPVRYFVSWLPDGNDDGYICKVYSPQELITTYSWNYYSIISFRNGRRCDNIFGKYLVNLLTGLREDGSPHSCLE